MLYEVITENRLSPSAAGLRHKLTDHAQQVIAMSLHALSRDAVDFDQLVVVAVDEGVVQIEYSYNFV